MLLVATLLLLASSLMGLTTFNLALFSAALAVQTEMATDVLGSGLCVALGLMAIWSETSLGLVQIGILRGLKPASEGHVAAGIGLATACFICLVDVPGAPALVPVLTAVPCHLAVWHKRQSFKAATLSTLALMTDKGECRYLRGLILMIMLAFLLRRLVT